jgi:hypothetical protein
MVLQNQKITILSQTFYTPTTYKWYVLIKTISLKAMPSIVILTAARRHVFSRSAPTQPVNPMINVTVPRKQRKIIKYQCSLCLRQFFLLLTELRNFDVNSLLGLLHCLVVGDVVHVSEVHAVSVFRAKDGDSKYLQNVGIIAQSHTV